MKVSLRAVEPEDADFMFEAESDPAAWEYSDYLAPLSRELLHQYAISYDADPFRSGQLRLIVEYGDTPVGITDLFDISPRHLRAEIGIYILPQFRNKGLGVSALEGMAEYAKLRLGLHMLTAKISAQNIAAVKCFEQAGFIQTGTLPDWLRHSDSYQSVITFSHIL